MSDILGVVASGRRYPVKSMMGEEPNVIDIGEHGVVGDRAYAFVDVATGALVSAKNPKKWPDIFFSNAQFLSLPKVGDAHPAVRITFPDGTVAQSDQSDINQIASRIFGREVRLETAITSKPHLEQFWPEGIDPANSDVVTQENTLVGTFFDAAPIHILTTSTINQLRKLYPEGRFEARRFRPNIVVDTGTAAEFVENDWAGKTLAIGDEVRLEISSACPRCVMTTLAQGDLPKDYGILSTIVQGNKGNVGIYAKVIQGGSVKRGDAVRLI
ncbi:MAG: MOSC domain-containing protein [Methylophilaceae bacterium]|nr:MOSC domain-containing protein [Methylophilaceae bacterium]